MPTCARICTRIRRAISIMSRRRNGLLRMPFEYYNILLCSPYADPRYYYYCYSYNTRGIQRRAAVRRPRADWLPLQRARRVTPADLHTIYITRARTQEIARPIIMYYNTWTGNTSYLLDCTAAAADTCPRLGSTCTIIFDNAFLTHRISDNVVCIRLLLCSFVAEKS